MHTIDLYRWRLTESWTGRRLTTRYRMTEADARRVDAAAEPVEGSLERRQVPDDWLEMSTSGWQHRMYVDIDGCPVWTRLCGWSKIALNSSRAHTPWAAVLRCGTRQAAQTPPEVVA